MTVKIRKYEKSKRVGWEADISFEWPGGVSFRRRVRAPVNTEAQAKRWAEDLERRIYAGGPDGPLAKSKRAKDAPTHSKEVPTFKDFWPTFISGHCIANRQKPSGIERKQCAYRTWLAPRFDTKRLDEIGPKEVSALKADLANLSAKSANNVLTALSACLKFAGPVDEGLRQSEGLGILTHVPRIRLLPIDKDDAPAWYEPSDYRRIVEWAGKKDPRFPILVLLAGSAGLRRGEIMALKWSDVDMKSGDLRITRSIWWARGGVMHETINKGRKARP